MFQGVHWLDILTICILVISFLYSLSRGLVRELFSLCSTIIAAILATHFCSLGDRFLSEFIDAPKLNNILGFITIFILVSYLGSIIGSIGSNMIKSSKASPIDRFWGGMLGLVKGTLVISLLLLLLILFLPKSPQAIDNTKVARFFKPVSEQLAYLLPTGLKKKFIRHLGEKNLHSPGDLIGILQPKLKSKLKKRAIRKKSAIEKDKQKIKKIIEDNL